MQQVRQGALRTLQDTSRALLQGLTQREGRLHGARRPGYSLIELLVTLAIILIIIGIGVLIVLFRASD